MRESRKSETTTRRCTRSLRRSATLRASRSKAGLRSSSPQQSTDNSAYIWEGSAGRIVAVRCDERQYSLLKRNRADENAIGIQRLSSGLTG
jgi:hypothetical protein